ncbi:MAG: peptidoglycan-binding domain-containing protein [Gammaproteobacteria bacterium]|jgi:peptidoglycan hydrolase-like protein with peptidoglycan-binding domain
MNLRTIVCLLVVIALQAAVFQACAAERSRVVYHVQMRLLHKGYDPGPTDGVMGKLTRRAVANFQWDNGLRVTGELTTTTLKKLGLRVYSYAQIGAARLKVLDVPPVEYSRTELLSRVKKLRVSFNGKRDLVLFNVNGESIHTGQITELIKDECLRPYEVSIGEMYVRGQSLKAADYGDIFARALQGKLRELHRERSKKAIQTAHKEMVLICTAAMF